MVNFRYHLVSLTAVFIALAIGIAMGATVVDRATVDFLETRLSGVETNSKRTELRNRRLNEELKEWNTFADEADNQLVAARLTGTRVLLVAIEGTPRSSVTAVTNALTVARAELGGVLWLNSRLQMAKPGDLAAIAPVVGETVSRPVPARAALVSRLAAALDTAALPVTSPSSTTSTAATATTVAEAPGLLQALAAVKGVTYEPPAAGGDLSAIPQSGTRIVLLSAAGATATNETVTIPLARAIVARNEPLIAADVTPASQDGADDEAPFARPLRVDSSVNTRLSTIDHAATFRGRLALVLALVDLGRARLGHYGTEARATRLIPAP